MDEFSEKELYKFFIKLNRNELARLIAGTYYYTDDFSLKEIVVDLIDKFKLGNIGLSLLINDYSKFLTFIESDIKENLDIYIREINSTGYNMNSEISQTLRKLTNENKD